MEHAWLIAGLGNPGREYAQTRHNAGFMTVEALGRRWDATWKDEGRFQSAVARIPRGGSQVILCRPLTYMNASGEAVGPLAGFYKVGRVMVVVDDADLEFGLIRLRPEGRSGGHHGLESVEKHLGTQAFARQRIGIGRGDGNVRQITGHVLARFRAEERPRLERVLQRACDQLECCLDAGVQAAMNQFNGRVD